LRRRGFDSSVNGLKKPDNLEDKIGEEGIKNDPDQSRPHAFNLEHLRRGVNLEQRAFISDQLISVVFILILGLLKSKMECV
jgi:hypothetical protein